MRKIIILILPLILSLIIINSSNAQLPTYKLSVTNWTMNLPVNNEIEFDIIIENTSSAPFEFASGQYFFTFNNLVATDNNDLEYSIVPKSSDLPENMQPRILGNGIGTYSKDPLTPSINLLRLAFNSIPGCGKAFMISPGAPGVKIVRMKLRRLSGEFNHQLLDLEWRNPPEIAFVTKIFAYISEGKNCVNTDITTPETHIVDPFGILPVELASFTSSTARNNINLFWTTTTEYNNAGFDIERKDPGANEWNKIININGNGTTKETKSYSFTDRVNTGKYNYRLKQIDFNGNYTYYNLSHEVEIGVPEKYFLSQNYPNPFNPSTKIDFDIPVDGKVEVEIYDVTGRKLSTPVNEFRTAGYYTIQFYATNLASGIYFYTIRSKDFTASKKMALIK